MAESKLDGPSGLDDGIKFSTDGQDDSVASRSSYETASDADTGSGADKRANRRTASQKGQRLANRISISDFSIGILLGEGAYARVYVCRLKNSSRYFAVKVMDKGFIVREKKIDHVNMERKVLSTIEHPLLARLYFSFHDIRTLYMVIDLCNGGELQKLIVMRKKWNLRKPPYVANRALALDDARFYFAETVSAVQYLHSIGFIHRDIKPDNILLCGDGHIKLTDFGTAKDEKSLPVVVEKEHGEAEEADGETSEAKQSDRKKITRRGTFCGTADYVSPEVLNDGDPSVGADYWALGCLLYHLIVGESPFQDLSEYYTFQNIMSYGSPEAKKDAIIPDVERAHHTSDQHSMPIDFPYSENEGQLQEAQNLISRLLIVDPAKRLGASNNCSPFHPDFDAESVNGPNVLREHPFFASLDISRIHLAKAPDIPYCYEVPEPNVDGSSSHWMIASDLSELEMARAHSSRGESATSTDRHVIPPGGFLDEPEDFSVEGIDSTVRISSYSELRFFLQPNERIVIDGMIIKRRGIFHNNSRHLALTTLPRFLYIDPGKLVLKGEILITTDVHVVVKNEKCFDVVTPNRTYQMTTVVGNANTWGESFATVKKNRVPTADDSSDV